jgi:hypothetical protein
VVIGDRFAWGHLEKTGGDATLQLFEQVPELVRFADPVDAHDKHRSFPAREAEVQGKILALNVRRLPAWILSKAQHAARHGTYPDYEPWHMASPHEMAQSREPDARLAAFTGDGRFPVDRWLRAEFLADDFLAFVTGFGEVSVDQRRAITDLARIHGSATQGYDHQIEHWFTAGQVQAMYERNPVWAALERRLYGSLGT